MSNMVLRGAIELPWPKGFQIGVTLNALLKGALRGHKKGGLWLLNKNGQPLILLLYYTRVFISRKNFPKTIWNISKRSKIIIFKPHLDAFCSLSNVHAGLNGPYTAINYYAIKLFFTILIFHTQIRCKILTLRLCL